MKKHLFTSILTTSILVAAHIDTSYAGTVIVNSSQHLYSNHYIRNSGTSFYSDPYLDDGECTLSEALRLVNEGVTQVSYDTDNYGIQDCQIFYTGSNANPTDVYDSNEMGHYLSADDGTPLANRIVFAKDVSNAIDVSNDLSSLHRWQPPQIMKTVVIDGSTSDRGYVEILAPTTRYFNINGTLNKYGSPTPDEKANNMATLTYLKLSKGEFAASLWFQMSGIWAVTPVTILNSTIENTGRFINRNADTLYSGFSFTMKNSILENNQGSQSATFVGDLDNGSRLELVNNIFRNNVGNSHFDDAGDVIPNGVLTITAKGNTETIIQNNTFVGNVPADEVTDNDGNVTQPSNTAFSAIRYNSENTGNSLEVSNNTFIDNTFNNGLLSISGTADLVFRNINNTVIDNTVSGAAVYNIAPNLLANSVFSNNIVLENGAGPTCDKDIGATDSNLLFDASCGNTPPQNVTTLNIFQLDSDGNPDLRNNGCSNRYLGAEKLFNLCPETVALNQKLPNNPAINTGDADATATDQRFQAAISTRDLGAYESGAIIIDITPFGNGEVNTTGEVDATRLSSSGNILNCSADNNANCSVTYEYSVTGEVELTATPDADNVFLGWECDVPSTDAVRTIALTDDFACQAKFSDTPVTHVTFSVTGDGSVTADDSQNPAVIGGIDGCSANDTANCDAYYPQSSDNAIIFTATPAAGHAFVNWSCSPTTLGNAFTLLPEESEVNCTANFTTEPAIKVDVTVIGKGSVSLTATPDDSENLGGSIDGCRADALDNCYVLYKPSMTEDVTLTATPDVDSTLQSWECNGVESTYFDKTLSRENSVSCIATFTDPKNDNNPDGPVVSVNITVVGKGNVSISDQTAGAMTVSGAIGTCTSPYDTNECFAIYKKSADDSITLSAQPEVDHQLISWSCSAGKELTLDYTLDENLECTVTFTDEPAIVVAVVVSGRGSVSLTADTSNSLIDGSINGCIEPSANDYNADNCYAIFATSIDDSITLTSTEDSSAFQGWSGCVESSDASIDLSLNNNHNCLATFDNIDIVVTPGVIFEDSFEPPAAQ